VYRLVSELNSIISKIEDAMMEIESVDRRLVKADELSEEARKRHEDTTKYDLAKREYQYYAWRIVRRIASYTKELEVQITDLVREAPTEDEALRDQGMHEVELEIKRQ